MLRCQPNPGEQPDVSPYTVWDGRLGEVLCNHLLGQYVSCCTGTAYVCKTLNPTCCPTLFSIPFLSSISFLCTLLTLSSSSLRHTAVKPQERMKNILEGLRPIGKDEYAKAFGISIEDKFKQVAGREAVQKLSF